MMVDGHNDNCNSNGNGDSDSDGDGNGDGINRLVSLSSPFHISAKCSTS